MSPVMLGLTVHADRAFLECATQLLTDLDYLEVTPETLWRWDAQGARQPNGYHPWILALGRSAGLAFVGHGIGLSLGSLADDARQHRWCDRIRADHAAFDFRWYTEHLGATMLGEWHVALPCPLPMTAPHARAVRRQLEALRDIVGTAGVENTANHFCLGSPLDEPAFLAAATDAPGLHLLLDLHNLHAMARNLDFDPRAYLARLPLERVIEIHLAGGGESAPAWLPSRRCLVLDGHDRDVPETVWDLFAWVLPRCSGLRGVTLERMSGTLAPSDVDGVRADLRRARRLLAGVRATTAPSVAFPRPLAEERWTVADERAYGLALCRPDPVTALQEMARNSPEWLHRALIAADVDGIRITALLIAKLRFERIVNGSAAASGAFCESPAAFAAAFRAYHHAAPPIEHAPWREARSFRTWCRAMSATA